MDILKRERIYLLYHARIQVKYKVEISLFPYWGLVPVYDENLEYSTPILKYTREIRLRYT